MAIEYRLAKPTDLKALLPLAEAFAHEQQSQTPTDNQFTDRFMEYVHSGLAQTLAAPVACVMVAEAEVEGKQSVVGYAVGVLQGPPPIFEDVPYIFLSDLYVLPEFRRQGVGTALIERVRGWGWVKGVYRVSSVAPTGSPVHSILGRLGFLPVQTMYYYKDPE
ncbi:MAG TPA: GNAT family N-acetyltransferase [Symbiobacteriaceae bacterium]|nr:GNAT family N-acetyltransferase [Symbiobacteriaceae bacterium]